jgi:hypothetical protein
LFRSAEGLGPLGNRLALPVWKQNLGDFDQRLVARVIRGIVRTMVAGSWNMIVTSYLFVEHAVSAVGGSVRVLFELCAVVLLKKYSVRYLHIFILPPQLTCETDTNPLVPSRPNN